MRITKSLEGQYEIVYASTHPRCAKMVETSQFYLMPDFSRQDAWRILPSFFRLLRILRRERPDAVLTTGAAPGLICIFAAWILRVKTIWVDSTANAIQLSASGRIATRFASRVYTQWPDLAQGDILYAGIAPQPPKGGFTTPPLGGRGAGIFVVTGTQLPFDRLIKILDEIAPELHEEIVAQVNGSQYLPRHVNTIDILPPDEFDRLFSQARLIVAHAGIGTIISAMQYQKPIIIFPRIAALGEHRNEHQLATATKMKEAGWVYVATDKDELKSLLLATDLHPLCTIGSGVSESLVKSLTDFIEQ